MRIIYQILFISFLSLALLGMACQNTGQSTKDDTEQTGDNETDSETDPPEETQSRPSPAKIAEGSVGDLNIKIDYSSPGVKGRKIWGGLVPYGEVWRSGANEATTLEVDQDVTIAGEPLSAGRYGLFTIPTEENWTLILNEVADQWGAYEYDQAKDVLRLVLSPQMVEEVQERLEYRIAEDGTVTLSWEKMRLPFKVAKAGE